jgi:hypothetical protein
MRKAQAAIRDERAKQGRCADNIRQRSSDKRPSIVAAVRTVPLSETGPTRVPLVEHRAWQEGHHGNAQSRDFPLAAERNDRHDTICGAPALNGFPG